MYEFFENTYGNTRGNYVDSFSPNDLVLTIIDDFHEIFLLLIISLSQANKSKMVIVFGSATLQFEARLIGD